MRQSYFTPSEFLSPQLPESERLLWEGWRRLSGESTLEILDKIQMWINILNPLRIACGFPLIITDGLRLHGRISSQHRFFGDGALDLRAPLGRTSHSQIYTHRMTSLGRLLAESQDIARVCYYRPSNRFPNAGFHIDRKGNDKQLFVNEGSEINWTLVTKDEFITAIS